MQKIETYQPKEKNYGTIGTLMIKTIKTLNPSFSLPSRHQHKVSHCSSKFDADLTIAATLESYQMTEPRVTRHYPSCTLLAALLAAATHAVCADGHCWPRALLCCVQSALIRCRCQNIQPSFPLI